MKLILYLVITLLFSEITFPQNEEWTVLNNLGNTAILHSDYDKLPNVIKENVPNNSELINIVTSKLPNLKQGGSEAFLFLSFNIYVGENNQYFGNIKLECQRYATISKTGHEGIFTVWQDDYYILYNYEGNDKIKKMINDNINSLFDHFKSAYDNSKQK
jgi:hypothetical protein